MPRRGRVEVIIYHQLLQGAFLIALTVLVHALGSLYFLWVLNKAKLFLIKHQSPVLTMALLTWVVGTLVCLHLLEIFCWGFYYHQMGIFKDFETSAYYSLMTYTTVGYGDVLPPREWRLMGTSEALVGIMMTAWSTALLIGVISRVHEKVFDKISKPQRHSETAGGE
jgi:hypothetical protein